LAIIFGLSRYLAASKARALRIGQLLCSYFPFAQLPEKSDDAIIILRLAIELAEGFLADSDKPEPAKVLTIVRDPA
jgi:hypothetical protein